MKVKELIKHLEKHDKNAEVVLWTWTGKDSEVRTLIVGCTQKVKEFYFLAVLEIPKHMDPNYLKHEEMKA